MFYRIFRALIGVSLRIYYRRIEAPGLENIPREVPLLLVANHGNALLDPLILLVLLPRPLSFLAKHTLFGLPVIGFFTRRLGGLPVYRRQDAPAEAARNEDTLDACGRILRSGGAVCLFPEGVSHHRPRLEALKSGAARIYFRALREAPVSIQVVPVGINFESKRAFRSRALVIFGAPVATAEFTAGDASTGGVERLTDRIEEALRALVPDLDTWEELEFVRGIKDLYLGGREGSLAEEAPSLKRFIEGYRHYKDVCPERVAHLSARWKAYRRQMRRFAVTERQLRLSESPVRAARFLLGSALVIGLVLPLAAVGFVVHIVPYLLTEGVERKLNRHPDLGATFKFITGLALVPMTYLIVLAMFWSKVGWRGAVPALILLPLTGWAALQVAENRQRLSESARALFIALPGGRPLDEIRREREGILAEVIRLIRDHPPAEPRLSSGARGEAER
jgi:glycerol-3-phosphate O-acyltransferase/dihydroxyacetone phosphate acyltransferase